ncbi:cell wall synthase accessory phosphoprotein MacP [Streptococcus loxodontisalivarius]|uniref:Foldase n=1 Tax=Streptococcus loxodontisalivarius TaxID=1349415 RepID=A0ABS2PT13_9STRE|nr:cell wall synthase accessory phosphoprotein MacP [Streptococcus loxodontisalivarius]MBM7643073.1 hypothetical protein [Streptococcus loxodontisalivarius]
MGKPLLTDDIIKRAERGEFEQDSRYFDDEDTLVLDRDDLSQQLSAEDDKRKIVKSRRIENAKRGEFQSKVNRILLIVIILVILLFWAVFKL